MKSKLEICAVAFAATFGIFLSGCSEKLDSTLSEDNRRVVTISTEALIADDSGAQSKATWEDGKGLQWDASSDATALGLADNAGSNTASTALTIASDGRATFTGEVSGSATKLLAYYPKAEAKLTSESATLKFNISTEQTQSAAGKMDSSEGRLLLVGKAPIDLGTSSSYSASMRMISSLARFLVYSSEGKTDQVKSVSVTSDAVIAGDRVALVNWTNEGNSESAGSYGAKTAMVTLSAPLDLTGITSKADAKGIYLGVLPASSASTTYKVTTDKGIYVFTASSAKEFLSGTIHNIPLNLDKAAFTATCRSLTQGQEMDFGKFVDISTWNFDPDFFTVDSASKKVTFNAVSGLYRLDYNIEKKWIRVEPMKDESTTLSLSDDGSGAVWVIGSKFGKPAIGYSWNTTAGAYAMAQVSDKVYQFTLSVPGQLSATEGEIKFYGQKGWGTELKKANYASADLGSAFTMSEDGNIKVDSVESGRSYCFTLDLTGGISAAKLSVALVDLRVNGVKAEATSTASVYKVAAAPVEQNGILSLSGFGDLSGWTFDADHFTKTTNGLKFNAVSGYYSFELNLKDKYVIVRHVTSDGSAATYAAQKAITCMGWGMGYPMMSKQFGWADGMLVTLAQISDGVYQFTGKAVADEKSTEIVGNCWRTDYLSFKFFGQAGWGAEHKTITLTEEAAKYLKQDGNMSLADGVKLEEGATYRMTVSNCSALDANSKFDVTIDFRKLE